MSFYRDPLFWLGISITALVASAVFLGGFVLYLWGDMRRTRKKMAEERVRLDAELTKLSKQIDNIFRRLGPDTKGGRVVIVNLPLSALTQGQQRKLAQELAINQGAEAHKLSDGRTVIFSSRDGAPYDIDVTND